MATVACKSRIQPNAHIKAILAILVLRRHALQNNDTILFSKYCLGHLPGVVFFVETASNATKSIETFHTILHMRFSD